MKAILLFDEVPVAVSQLNDFLKGKQYHHIREIHPISYPAYNSGITPLLAILIIYEESPNNI